MARPNDRLVDPIGETPEGWPIYERSIGFLFTVVVEAKPGPSRRAVGLNTFRHDPFDSAVRPDFEIIVSRALGDGSSTVCDNMLPDIGGVPASAGFDTTPAISGAINDFGCRFVDGTGNFGGRGEREACTLFEDGDYHFKDPFSTAQFCAGIAEPFRFAVGDTTVHVRARDVSGTPGPPATFVVRITP